MDTIEERLERLERQVSELRAFKELAEKKHDAVADHLLFDGIKTYRKIKKAEENIELIVRHVETWGPFRNTVLQSYRVTHPKAAKAELEALNFVEMASMRAPRRRLEDFDD